MNATILSPRSFGVLFLFLTVCAAESFSQQYQSLDHNLVSTFSIVGCDTLAGEAGVAVASRFFAVGTVVPWARADIGAIATQSFANTSYGWRGLDLLGSGKTPEQVKEIFMQSDSEFQKRQFGIVAADGNSTTFTGKECLSWAGGRSGRTYAVQGNILTGEPVVAAMESVFLKTKGTLADRLYAALCAGDQQGGDSRGRQSAALIVVKKNAGYGGFNDKAIDIRVDDHPDPFRELGRLLNYAQMNYSWNEAWTFFTHKQFERALPCMERTALLAPENPEVLYDLTVIRTAAGKISGALEALEKALMLNPKLKQQASADGDLNVLKPEAKFRELVK
ncbi:MAG: DUF1028 domain-containing protein [Ignavibacteriae bacterium]|nr:MAG: DUF1028 domain-containing protein [Ignavibacteriota bacterium]